MSAIIIYHAWGQKWNVEKRKQVILRVTELKRRVHDYSDNIIFLVLDILQVCEGCHSGWTLKLRKKEAKQTIGIFPQVVYYFSWFHLGNYGNAVRGGRWRTWEGRNKEGFQHQNLKISTSTGSHSPKAGLHTGDHCPDYEFLGEWAHLAGGSCKAALRPIAMAATK